MFTDVEERWIRSRGRSSPVGILQDLDEPFGLLERGCLKEDGVYNAERSGVHAYAE